MMVTNLPYGLVNVLVSSIGSIMESTAKAKALLEGEYAVVEQEIIKKM